MIARVRDVPAYHIHVCAPMRLLRPCSDDYGLTTRHAPPTAITMIGGAKALAPASSKGLDALDLTRALARGIYWKHQIGQAEKHYSYERSFLQHLAEMGVKVSRAPHGGPPPRPVTVFEAPRGTPHPTSSPPAEELRARVWQANLPQPTRLQASGILPSGEGWCTVLPPIETEVRELVQEHSDLPLTDSLHATVLQAALLREYAVLTKADHSIELRVDEWKIRRLCKGRNRKTSQWICSQGPGGVEAWIRAPKKPESWKQLRVPASVASVGLTCLADPSREIASSRDVLEQVPDEGSFGHVVGRAFRGAARVLHDWRTDEWSLSSAVPWAKGGLGDSGLLLAARRADGSLDTVLTGPEDPRQWECAEANVYVALLEGARVFSRIGGTKCRCWVWRPRDGSMAHVTLLPEQAVAVAALTIPQRVPWNDPAFVPSQALRAVEQIVRDPRSLDLLRSLCAREETPSSTTDKSPTGVRVVGGGGGDTVQLAIESREILTLTEEGEMTEAKLVVTEPPVDMGDLPDAKPEDVIYMVHTGMAEQEIQS